MNRSSLEHVIRAASAVADDSEIIVIGSQAIPALPSGGRVGQFAPRMTAKETAVRALEGLSERDLEEVSRHLKLLQLRARARARPAVTPEQLALYAESAEEDRLLAEEGMDDYAAALRREDEAA